MATEFGSETQHRVPVEALRRRCAPASLPFETTAELAVLSAPLGQDRAIEAIELATGMRAQGYNLFAIGPPGLGKRRLIRKLLGREAETRPQPDDWCYVHNFDAPQRPRALRLAPGRGRALRDGVGALVEELRITIPAVFESDEFRSRSREIEAELDEKKEIAFKALQTDAEAHGLKLLHTPGGFAFAPTENGEVIGPDQYGELPKPTREALESEGERLQNRLAELIRDVPRWQRESRIKQKAVERELVAAAVEHDVAELRSKFEALPDVVAWIDALCNDVLEHAGEFKPSDDRAPNLLEQAAGKGDRASDLRYYAVNLVIDNEDGGGAPVVTEDNPTWGALLGRVEHRAQFGHLTTDFTLIRGGALHRANGGYLLLDARLVLTRPYAWDAVKRVLQSREIEIESLGEALSLVSTLTLDPEPIPFDGKIVLLGDRWLYMVLNQHDPEFRGLFKIAADFDDRVPRDDAHGLLYARLIATVAEEESLPAFDRDAVARIIEERARASEDAEKLHLHMAGLTDLMRESAFHTRKAARDVVTAGDVDSAVRAAIRRADRLRERLYEEMTRQTLRIETEGARPGQINALAVVSTGDFDFGHPSRITATARIGDGKVIDIQREVKLGGAFHSKGVLILSSYLAARYAPEHPLSMSASLVFEQSYAHVDGDSASAAELCALLSALADAPIRQTLSMTGAVDQLGHVQAIGGVNQKIEGFFDVCAARGELDGRHGVIIPAANVRHLMLRPDVVAAVAADRFHVYRVEHVDEALALLTRLPAGERVDGSWQPACSVNARVERRLLALSRARAKFAAEISGKPGDT